MEFLDRVLGLLELVVVPASLLWLILDGARVRSMLAVGLVALTVAQPLGIVATSQSGPPPPDATILNPGGVHVARLAGIPLMPFVIYRRQEVLGGLGENSPTATLRARSWLWLPILTNSTNVARICSPSIFTPCWRPGNVNAIGGRLGLARKGDDLWLTLTNATPGLPQLHAPQLFVWKLSPGLASPLGLAYWILAAVLILGLRRRTRWLARQRA